MVDVVQAGGYVLDDPVTDGPLTDGCSSVSPSAMADFVEEMLVQAAICHVLEHEERLFVV
jgi:hypothetical protein